MRRNELKKWILIGGFILALLFFFYVILYTKYYHEINRTNKCINGKIDLSNVDLSKEKIYLDGQWEFYWNQLIHSDSEQYAKPDFIIKVPEEWSQYKVNGRNLSAEGFGSYKLNLKVSYDKAMTLYIPDFGSAYRVYIDGVLVSKSGIVSKDLNRIFTTPKAELYHVFLTGDSSHEVVIEVATTRFSGLYMAPILGDYKHIVNDNEYRSSTRFILFGIALFSFFCLIAMYFIAARKKEQTFWMPVMMLILLMRIMLTSEFYSFWQPILFRHLSYESSNELMYMTTFVLKYLLIFLLQEQCGIKFYSKEKISFFLYYSFLFLVYLVVPRNIYNHYLSVLIPMLTFALDGHMFAKVYRQRDSMIKYGSAIFIGTILVITGIAIDGFYINGKIYMNMSLTLLLLFTICALIMSCVFALRSADFYDEYVKSSLRLELAQSQIDMQKIYYESLSNQMNEIREIKHDMRHIIGVMSQLSEDGKFDKLREFLREYTKNTGIEQIPVFCEHTVVNSLIGYYYLKAKEEGIIFESKCCVDGPISLGDIDLCIVLGNALDNAVYACKQIDRSKNPFILVESKVLQGQCLMKISNSYEGKVRVKNGRYLSSKSGHGLGISNIEKVIESYKGYTKIEHDGSIFTLMAAIPEIR
jgi:hypothetical protein